MAGHRLQVFTNDAGGRHKFFMVWNYVRQLRRWIRAYQRRTAAIAAAAAAQVHSWSDPSSDESRRAVGSLELSDALNAVVVALQSLRGFHAAAAEAPPAGPSSVNPLSYSTS